MGKTILFFVFFLPASLNAFGQSLEQKVINSSGAHFISENQVTVSMGESAIGHIKTADYHVSVGFIQPFSLEVELVNGLKHDLLARVDIYPNPTTKYVNLKILSLGEVGSEVSAVVYNQQGISVRKFVLYTAGYIQQVDFSDLPSGVYMLKLSTASKNNTYRIIKK
jgi:type IX secretion system substrate protein